MPCYSGWRRQCQARRSLPGNDYQFRPLFRRAHEHKRCRFRLPDLPHSGLCQSGNGDPPGLAYHHDGSPADGVSGPGHPHTDKQSDLTPVYAFWNRLSDNYLLGDDASQTYDGKFDTYPTSRPIGDVNDATSKLYPFKYKTAVQPQTLADNRLIALDTFEYLKAS